MPNGNSYEVDLVFPRSNQLHSVGVSRTRCFLLLCIKIIAYVH